MNNTNTDKSPTPQQVRDNENAVRMIILVACLNYAMVDVQCELDEAGMYKHKVKRYFNMANRLVMDAHDIFFKMLSNKNFVTATKQYLYHSDRTWENINECVSSDKLSGAVNKALSLCRLAIKYNNGLRGRYDCYIVEKLSNVEKFLLGLGEQDYNLDFILEKQLSY